MKKEKTIHITIEELRTILHLQVSLIKHGYTCPKLKRMDRLLTKAGVTDAELVQYEDLYQI